MKLALIKEPSLEFADGGRHLDPRFGVLQYGPLDAGASSETRLISVGIIGTNATILGLRSWLERCRDPLRGKPTHLRNLFPDFPGFAGDTMFQAELVFDDGLDRAIGITALRAAIRPAADATRRAVCELVLDELSVLLERQRPDIVLIALPLEILERVEPAAAEDASPPRPQARRRERRIRPIDFHDLLKARAMPLRTPLQLVNPETYDPAVKRRQKGRADRLRQLQDPTTRAWNLHTALYYKGGGYPWRLPRREDDVATCFLGVSFFETLDGESLWSSIAQVFNERGVGMVIRGGPAHQSKLDHQPHLSGADSERLVENAMERYRKEWGHLPARLVVHKSSVFTPEELAGFRTAISDLGIGSSDLLSLRRANSKLFRFGSYPPQRGTLWSLERDRHILYTRGSVPFFETYPGMYVPRPIEFRIYDPEQTPEALGVELLALTKMNWNNTQFDQRDPITLRAADEVKDILRYMTDGSYVEPSYAAYM
jgi:hypothetical protein